MKNKTHVCIVNLNNLKYLQNCISDLLKQDTTFNCTIIDQHSTQSCVKEFYEELVSKYSFITVKYNNYNQPLNHVWNWFAENHNEKYLCFLNNDVRIPTNFISDSEKVFEYEPDIGITFHSTNHPSYFKKTNLSYIKHFNNVQGWDYTLRNECYSQIPEKLRFYAGDYYIYSKIYNDMNMCSGCITSSPIIHYQGKSAAYCIDNNKPWVTDGIEYSKLKNMGRVTKYPKEYSIVRPTLTVEKNWKEHNLNE